jgi:hypothetical protein
MALKNNESASSTVVLLWVSEDKEYFGAWHVAEDLLWSRDHRDDVIDVGDRGIEFEFDLMDDAAMAVMRRKLMI